MSDNAAFRILSLLTYILPLSMLITPILSDKTIEQVIIPSILLLILVIIGFEIMHNKYILLPKEMCNKLIKNAKSKYIFNKKCHELASKIFYLHVTINFGIILTICVITCHNFILELGLLIAIIISSTRTSIPELRKLLQRGEV